MNKQELELLEHEAQRKIGRNIMNFQNIEFMLKHLISRSQLHGRASELADNLEKNKQDIHKKTLGLLAKDLFNTVYTDTQSVEPPSDLAEPWISFTFTSETDESALNDFKLKLENLINQRNELIHHKLHSIEKDSHESWQELIDYLDNQREETIPIFDRLHTLGLSLIEMSNELKQLDMNSIRQS